MQLTKIRLGIIIASSAVFLLLLIPLFFAPFRSRYPFVLELFFLYTMLLYLPVTTISLWGASAVRKCYTRIATTVFSLLLLLLCLSTLSYVVICTVKALSASAPVMLGQEMHRKAMMRCHLLGLTMQQLHVLDTETMYDMWLFEYAPFVGFKEKARQGTFVNVSDQGYRRTAHAAPHAAIKIYMFGGSTTFGYGVTDDQTIASSLQKMINDRFGPGIFEVRNYGRAAYNSTQQYILLWRLLREESKPQGVIFLNDFNERLKNPLYTRQMHAAFDLNQMSPIRQILFRAGSQLAYVGYVVRFCLGTKNMKNPLFEYATTDQAIREYRSNVSDIGALCGHYGIRPFFFLGPIAGFHNSYAMHQFCSVPPSQEDLLMMERLVSSVADLPVTNLTASLKDYSQQPFIDRWHYTPAVNKLLAGYILRSMTSFLKQSPR